MFEIEKIDGVFEVSLHRFLIDFTILGNMFQDHLSKQWDDLLNIGLRKVVHRPVGAAGAGAGRLALGPSWSFLSFHVDWGSLSSNIPQSLQNTLCTSLFEPLKVTFV